MTPTYEIVRGEALAYLRAQPDASFDAVITDPPYSSGGQFRGDRMQKTSTKYVQSGTKDKRVDFGGDNRDQRSFLAWATMWMEECARVTVPGGSMLVFTDWRQLPTMTDAVQCAGWVWRGVVPWDKGPGTRPQMGGPRAQAEYAVWATRGAKDADRDRLIGVLLGAYHYPVLQRDKWHQTGKPTALLRDLVKICPPGGRILDPFAGSGTTVVAALLEGRSAVGVEQSDHYGQIAELRSAAAALGELIEVPRAAQKEVDGDAAEE